MSAGRKKSTAAAIAAAPASCDRCLGRMRLEIRQSYMILCNQKPHEKLLGAYVWAA